MNGLKKNRPFNNPLHQCFIMTNIVRRIRYLFKKVILYHGLTISSYSYLPITTVHTSENLAKNGDKGNTKEDLIKWFGIIILATRIKFGNRDILCLTISAYKFRHIPYFGNTRINRQLYDII